MPNTNQTNWQSVDNGDTTQEDPNEIIGDSGDINLLSAQIKWRGVETSGTYTDYSTNTNSDSATATTTTNEGDTWHTDEDSFSASTTFPNESPHRSHEMKIIVRNNTSDFVDGPVTVEYDSVNGNNTLTKEFDYISPTDSEVFGNSGIFSNYNGETRSATITSGNTDDIEIYIRLVTNYVESTSTNSKTASTSYPSIPDGYNFDRHRHQEWDNNNEKVDNYYSSNKIGQSESRTSNDTDVTAEVRLKTRGTKQVTDYYQSEDPSVSGDVSASYNGTVSDGSTTGWLNLSNFSVGNNQINHSIGGSNKVEYKIKFTWEYTLPEAVAVESHHINGTTYDVILADADDPALEYSNYRVYVNGKGILAYDLVDPSNSDAIPKYIYHPTHGILALREKK